MTDYDYLLIRVPGYSVAPAHNGEAGTANECPLSLLGVENKADPVRTSICSRRTLVARHPLAFHLHRGP